MTKILFATFAALLFFITSCNESTSIGSESKESQVEKNLEANNVISKAFESGDVSALDSVIADDFVDHTDRGDIRGKDSLKAMVTFVHKTNKDMKMEKVKELADNDYVFSWMRFTGTHDGSMMPAGPYDMEAIQVTRFTNGKAVEHWEFMQPAEMMKMMESMKQMGTKNNADSAKAKSN